MAFLVFCADLYIVDDDDNDVDDDDDNEDDNSDDEATGYLSCSSRCPRRGWDEAPPPSHCTRPLASGSFVWICLKSRLWICLKIKL